MSEAGENSPHLDESERRQAAKGAPVGPAVIHEIVRDQGEEELARSSTGLAWSGFAAGASMGFSFLLEAVLRAGLPDEPWRKLVASFGYSLGFLIVVLGQQQLFTETTLTALIPTLTRRSGEAARATLRVWAVVLAANTAATIVFGSIAAAFPLFPADTIASMHALADQTVRMPFWSAIEKAGSAGWLIGLMVWLLPAAGSARPFIIILLTYTVAVFQLPHIVAGSVEAAYAVATGDAPPLDYVTRFFVPTLIGNALGGTVLVGLLNHAPLADRLRDEGQDAPTARR